MCIYAGWWLRINHLTKLAEWLFVYELSGCGFESLYSQLDLYTIILYYFNCIQNPTAHFVSLKNRSILVVPIWMFTPEGQNWYLHLKMTVCYLCRIWVYWPSKKVTFIWVMYIPSESLYQKTINDTCTWT